MVELKSKSNSVTEDSQAENTSNSTKEHEMEKQEYLDSELPEGESSVDSTKELKGLINMQIKEKSQENQG